MSESPGPAAFPPLALTLTRGGDAYISQHRGDFVTVDSSAPAPPGSTFEAHRPGVTIRVKVRGCRRHPLPDGRAGFRIEGRLVSPTRADRESLFGSQKETLGGSTFETAIPDETRK